MVILVNYIKDVRKFITEWRSKALSIGFVPTMGFLHSGHLQLMKESAKTCDKVVVSIFVNPTQFGPNEDYDKYPRDLKRDLKLCGEVGVDLVFAPPVEEMYPEKTFIKFHVETLADELCGKHRPGHFAGVLQVVAKLFNIVQPDYAFFGKKDAQQLIIIKRMVEELNFPIQIVPVDTVREEDGLAMSSRNTYLSEEERKIAPKFYEALKDAVALLSKIGIEEVKKKTIASLENAGFKPQYVEIVDLKTLQPVGKLEEGKEYMIAGAVFLGTTRLIDNLWFKFKKGRAVLI